MFHHLFFVSISTFLLIGSISCAKSIEYLYVTEPEIENINPFDPESLAYARNFVGNRFMDLADLFKLTVDNLTVNKILCGSFIGVRPHDGKEFTETRDTRIFGYPQSYKTAIPQPKKLSVEPKVLRSHNVSSDDERGTVVIRNVNSFSNSFASIEVPNAHQGHSNQIGSIKCSGDNHSLHAVTNKTGQLALRSTLGTSKAKITRDDGWTFNVNLSKIIPGTVHKYGEIYVKNENGMLVFETYGNINHTTSRDPHDPDCAIVRQI